MAPAEMNLIIGSGCGIVATYRQRSYGIAARDSTDFLNLPLDIKMDWSHLQNEHRIRVQQVLDRAEREKTLSLVTKKSKAEIESAMTRVKCWVCMDKSLVWGNRGFMANIDGAGTHDLLLCGACQPDAGGEHKYNHCRDWSFIEGGRYCSKNDYATTTRKLLIGYCVLLNVPESIMATRLLFKGGWSTY